MYAWIQSSIWANRTRSIYLLILFPAFLFGLLFVTFSFIGATQWLTWAEMRAYWAQIVGWRAGILWPVILIWWLISFFFYREIIFAFSDAHPITRKENPEIYNIVENLCISRWLATPNIGIIDDGSMNAFAIWRNPKNSRIVFSQWILNRLDRAEIEAVAAHELTHIINKDSLVMVIVIVFVWIIWTLWELLLRFWLTTSSKSGDNDKDAWQVKMILIVSWLVLLILGYLVYPFIQLALSRKREYLADAGSVELTKDKMAMISALQKISQDSVIESIKKQTVAAMCIESPFASAANWWSWIGEFFSTHPSIENRIKALQSY